MSIEAALVTRLLADGTVAGIIGTRVYYAVLIQNATLPAVRYQRVTSRRPSVMGVDTGLVETTFQIDCWAATLDGMADLRDACRRAVQRWRDLGASPAISDTFIDDERDHGREHDLEAYRGGLDIRIWHSE